MKRMQVWAVCGVLSLLGLAGCEDHVTKANFDRITIGMPLSEVETIMGGKGDLEEVTGTSISGAGIGSTATTPLNVYKWQKGLKAITVRVVDGKVVDKMPDRL